MKFKKRKQKLKSFLNEFKPIIDNHKDELPTFNLNNKYKKEQINTNSWFDVSKQKNNYKTQCNVVSFDELDKIKYKCVKVKMILTNIHKQIFQNWFKTSTYTYNKTLEFIRNNFNFTKKEVTRPILINEINNTSFYNKFYIRTQMNKERIKIQNLFKFTIDKKDTITNKNVKCIIDAHTLDKTIFQLVQNIKAAKSNLLRNNIKRFRLKFWKYTRPKQVIELEKTKITDGILCKSIFGNLPKIKYIYNGCDYDISNINHDFKISYNSILDEYLLLVPTDVKIINDKIRKDLIVLDPGLRTFMTGLSDNVMLNIGNNVNSTIRKLVKRKNLIKSNINISNKIKKNNERKINKKIYNLIDELHWKTINFLTNNFKTIFLGDMSAKSIVSKQSSIISDLMKVACLQSRFYDFRQRLKYKCYITNTKFKLVDEFYTSKTCSCCGSYNKKLEGNKIYNCINCKNIIDRDVNGCRNIYMKQYI
jgi:transposase